MKERWDSREREERTAEGEGPITNEKFREEKDREHRERKLRHNGNRDMTNLSATDVLMNKDLYMPGPAKMRNE